MKLKPIYEQIITEQIGFYTIIPFIEDKLGIKVGEFFLIKNASLVGNPNFFNYSPQSCTTFDTGSISATFSDNQQVLFSIPVSETSSGTEEFTEQIDLQPGEWISAVCKLGSGTATYASLTLNTIEDQ